MNSYFCQQLSLSLDIQPTGDYKRSLLIAYIELIVNMTITKEADALGLGFLGSAVTVVSKLR